MTTFDIYIDQISDYVDAMCKNGRLARETSCANSRFFLPFKVGTGASSGLVMKSDTFVELGSPTAGSCAFAVVTNQVTQLTDGRIRLIGPDIAESPVETLPFGQVILAAGEALTDDDYPALIESQYIGDWIEGYMVKSTPGRIWSRVSIDVVHKGFCFATLGQALIERVKSQIPHATAVEILFVTSDKIDLQPLQRIAGEIGAIAQSIKEQRWKERGIDIADCAFGGHCGSCPDKSVCDEVKKVSPLRKQNVQPEAERS